MYRLVKSFVMELWGTIRLLYWLIIPYRQGSLERKANKEIKELKNKNAIYKKFSTGVFSYATNLIDNNKVLTFSFFLLLSVISLIPVNYKSMPPSLEIPYAGTYDIPEFVLKKIEGLNNFLPIIAGVQATLFALIIPIAISLIDSRIRNREHGAELFGLLLKELKVKLITVSSALLLFWVIFEELLLNITPLSTNAAYHSIVTVWFIINLTLITCFILNVLKMTLYSFGGYYLRRIIIEQLYPEEMKKRIMKVLFLTISDKYKRDYEEDYT